MTHLNLESDECNIAVEFAEGASGPMADSVIAMKLVRALRAFNAGVSPKELKLEQVRPSAYAYKWETMDGREWNQIIRIDDSDPLMSFDFEDYFRLSEFKPHREVRLLIIELIVEHNAVGVEVEWPE